MPPEQNPKSSGQATAKLILAAVVLIFLSAVLGVAGYLSKNKAVKIQQSQVTPVMKLEATNQIIDETADWKVYRNEEYGLEVKYPDNIFQSDSTKSVLSHTLKNFHKYSEKDGSDLGLASDISIIFKKEDGADKGCNYLEQVLDIKSNGVSFQSKNVNGVKYESGAEGDGGFSIIALKTVKAEIFSGFKGIF